MADLSIHPPTRLARLENYSVALFCILTVALTFAILLIPLPVLAGPMLVVFIPTLVAIFLIILFEGKSRVRSRLFSKNVWRISLKWAAITLGVALALRLGVSALGIALGYRFQPGLFSPLLLATLLFAAGEEIGWRGYALPRLLERGRSPLAAALLLGLPWAFLHLALLLPGRMLAGAPPVALLLVMMSLSVLLAWTYLGAGHSLLAATLLHGGQNVLVFLNDGLAVGPANWLMAAVCITAALLVILLTKGKLGYSNQGA